MARNEKWYLGRLREEESFSIKIHTHLELRKIIFLVSLFSLLVIFSTFYFEKPSSGIAQQKVNTTSIKTLVVEPKKNSDQSRDWKEQSPNIKSIINNFADSKIHSSYPSWKVSFIDVPQPFEEIAIKELKAAGYNVREQMNLHLDLDQSVSLIGARYSYADGSGSSKTLRGDGTLVAILDSGIDDTHPDLVGKVRAWNDISGQQSPTTLCGYGDCYTYVGIKHPTAYDETGHGTLVASIVAGTGTGSNGKFAGVAPNAGLLVAKVCGIFGCGEKDVAAGFDWAIQQGADVISMSLGEINPDACKNSGWLDNAVQDAKSRNIIVVAAAGNDGSAEPAEYPACIPDVIAVGASFKNDNSYTVNNSYGLKGEAAFHAVVTMAKNDGSTVNIDQGTWEGDFDVLGAKVPGVLATTIDNSGFSGANLKVEGQWKKLDHPVLCGASYTSGWNPGDPLTQGDAFWETGTVSTTGYKYTNIEVDGWPLSTSGGLSICWESDYNTYYTSDQIGKHIWASNYGLTDSAAGGSNNGGWYVQRDNAVYYSNKPDVVAPGINVCAAKANTIWEQDGPPGPPTKLGAPNCGDDGYVMVSGTSISTPFVAGEAALLKEANPNANFAQLRNAIVSGTVQRTEYDPNYPFNPAKDGNGRISVPEALHDIMGCSANPTVSLNPQNYPYVNTSIALSYSISLTNSDPGDNPMCNTPTTYYMHIDCGGLVCDQNLLIYTLMPKQTQTLTLNAKSPGSNYHYYEITVTAEHQRQFKDSKFAQLIYTDFSYSLNLVKTSASLISGDQMETTIHMNFLTGGNGQPVPVNYNCDGLPSGASCTFTPETDGNCFYYRCEFLTLSTSPSTPPGFYPIEIVGTVPNSIGIVDQKTELQLRVVAPPKDYELYGLAFDSNSVTTASTGNSSVNSTFFSGGSHPHEIVITPDGKYAYITNLWTDSVNVFNVTDNSQIKSINVPGAYGIAASPDGKSIYVTNYHGSNVYVIGTSTNTVVNSIGPTGAYPINIVVSPDGKTAYTADQANTVNGNSITVLNLTNNSVIKRITGIGVEPFDLALTPDGKKLYVASPLISNGLTIINTADYSVIQNQLPQMQAGPIAISPDGKFAYVIDRGSLLRVVDIRSDTLYSTIDLKPFIMGPSINYIQGISVLPDGKFVYLTDGNNYFVVYSTDANDIVKTFGTQGSPGFGFVRMAFVNPTLSQGSSLGETVMKDVTPLRPNASCQTTPIGCSVDPIPGPNGGIP